MRQANPTPRISEIIAAASLCSGVTPQEITGARRLRPFVKVRQAVYYLARKHGYSYHWIAADVGGRDHTTIITGYQAAMNIISQEPAYAALVVSTARRAEELAAERAA